MQARVCISRYGTDLQVGAACEGKAVCCYEYSVKLARSSADDVMILQSGHQGGHVPVGSVTEAQLPFLCLCCVARLYMYKAYVVASKGVDFAVGGADDAVACGAACSHKADGHTLCCVAVQADGTAAACSPSCFLFDAAPAGLGTGWRVRHPSVWALLSVAERSASPTYGFILVLLAAGNLAKLGWCRERLIRHERETNTDAGYTTHKHPT